LADGRLVASQGDGDLHFFSAWDGAWLKKESTSLDARDMEGYLDSGTQTVLVADYSNDVITQVDDDGAVQSTFSPSDTSGSALSGVRCVTLDSSGNYVIGTDGDDIYQYDVGPGSSGANATNKYSPTSNLLLDALHYTSTWGLLSIGNYNSERSLRDHKSDWGIIDQAIQKGTIDGLSTTGGHPLTLLSDSFNTLQLHDDFSTTLIGTEEMSPKNGRPLRVRNPDGLIANPAYQGPVFGAENGPKTRPR